MKNFSALLATASLFLSLAASAEEKNFVVHEWGVLGVGLVGGQTVLGATDRYLESLPDFVLRNELLSPTTFIDQPQQPLIIFKPVVHFYGTEGQQVEVKIKMAAGFPVVYYPKPELEMNAVPTVDGSGKHGTLKDAQAMKWKFKLTKNDPGKLPAPPRGHWWNAARRVPSDYVVMDDGSGNERFLFYEGTTFENPSVTAAVAEKSILLKNSHTSPSAPVILLINDNGSHSGIYLESIAAGKAVEIAAAKLQPWDETILLGNCRKQWQACGMSAEEAIGIVDSWREELLEVPGFLLISRVPEPIYERIFPIEVKPKPSELTRACFVFDTLAAQDERKHWIPAVAKESRAIIAALNADKFKQRMAARGQLIARGELMMP
jgi:hypothetical protein